MVGTTAYSNYLADCFAAGCLVGPAMKTVLEKVTIWILAAVFGALITLGVGWWATAIVYAEELTKAMAPMYEQSERQTVALEQVADNMEMSDLLSQKASATTEYLTFRMLKMEVQDWTERDQADMDAARDRMNELDTRIVALNEAREQAKLEAMYVDPAQ